MKSFKNFLIEAPFLETEPLVVRPNVNTRLPTNNLYSLGSMKTDNGEYHFHAHSENATSPYRDERMYSGFITKTDNEGNHEVVGRSDFIEDRYLKDHFSSNFPELNKEHSKRGLMSELYKRWADHNNVTLISSRIHTRGGQNVWKELAQKGEVFAKDTINGGKPIRYDSTNPAQISRFYTKKRTARYGPHKWQFFYKGKK
jgi:hypothetical protein